MLPSRTDRAQFFNAFLPPTLRAQLWPCLAFNFIRTSQVVKLKPLQSKDSFQIRCTGQECLIIFFLDVLFLNPSFELGGTGLERIQNKTKSNSVPWKKFDCRNKKKHWISLFVFYLGVKSCSSWSNLVSKLSQRLIFNHFCEYNDKDNVMTKVWLNNHWWWSRKEI